MIWASQNTNLIHLVCLLLGSEQILQTIPVGKSDWQLHVWNYKLQDMIRLTKFEYYW